MAERYTRLFALTENLYQSGAPVMIAAGALLKDTQSGCVLAQLKLQSLSDKPIKAAKVNITPLDVVGNELGEAVEHQHLDLNINRDEAFGAKSPIYLPDATTRAFRAAVISVVFADNSVWEASSAAWEPLPAPVTLDEVYPDAELRKQFKLEFGAQSQYAYDEFSDLWRCPCGALNRPDEAKCHTCSCDLLALRGMDIAELEKRKDERLERERIAEEQRQERMRIAKEKAAAEAAKRAKKAKKIALIAAPIICVVVAFLIVLNSVIIPNSKYNKAVALMEAGKKTEAALLFGQLSDYKDAHERSLSAWDAVAERQTIAASYHHTIGLKSDGTVVAVGDNDDGQCDVGGWTDIVAVATGKGYIAIHNVMSGTDAKFITDKYHTVGLKSDGTVVAVGRNGAGQCDVEQWTDIVAISTGNYHTVGLKSNGTVVSVGANLYGEGYVEDWRDWKNIVAISACGRHTVGLKLDGTVKATGWNLYGQCDVSDWTDVVSIAAGGAYTVGLQSDGTVVAVGDNDYGQCNVDDWSDIVSVAAGYNHTVGLKSDGTVVAVGDNDDGQCDVDDWSDIVSVAAGYEYTVGLKSDGTVVTVGDNDHGQCDVSGWRNIKLP